MPKLKFISDLRNEESIIFKIKYLTDHDDNETKIIGINKDKSLRERFYELRKSKLYTLDPKHNIISEQTVNVENFLTLGRD